MNLQIIGKKVTSGKQPTLNILPPAKPKQISQYKPIGTTRNSEAAIKRQNPQNKKIPEKQKKQETTNPIQTRKQAEKVIIQIEEPVTIALEPKQEEAVVEKVKTGAVTEDFETCNGVLSFAPIDDKYSFYEVFLGKYIPVLKLYRKIDQIIPLTTGKPPEYSWEVEQKVVYELQIQQDEEEEAKRQKTVFKAAVAEPRCPCRKNSRVEELTAQLLAMDPSEYGSARHKQLLEERDLQDILFS